jgi:hypothetical protein
LADADNNNNEDEDDDEAADWVGRRFTVQSHGSSTFWNPDSIYAVGVSVLKQLFCGFNQSDTLKKKIFFLEGGLWGHTRHHHHHHPALPQNADPTVVGRL